ncbi:MAG TPA: hypothetical protein VH301_09315 [Usitatibacter sp.]|nr:hypothetical protein [Usitatibacter sp.]
MRWILAPAMRVVIKWPNSVKLPLIAVLFTLPLAIALWAAPRAAPALPGRPGSLRGLLPG